MRIFTELSQERKEMERLSGRPALFRPSIPNQPAYKPQRMKYSLEKIRKHDYNKRNCKHIFLVFWNREVSIWKIRKKQQKTKKRQNKCQKNGIAISIAVRCVISPVKELKESTPTHRICAHTMMKCCTDPARQ